MCWWLWTGEVEHYDLDDHSFQGDARVKLEQLSSCFAQLTHKAQTIFQVNAKLEVGQGWVCVCVGLFSCFTLSLGITLSILMCQNECWACLLSWRKVDYLCLCFSFIELITIFVNYLSMHLFILYIHSSIGPSTHRPSSSTCAMSAPRAVRSGRWLRRRTESCWWNCIQANSNSTQLEPQHTHRTPRRSGND